ncbi:probable protein phosphatase 2C 55 [Primulina huaijiensis]|uniref:probable protein phosphatase 2C 55 n=1 Tax=Primulina huaijiensis TaxID=1492673 RepID=UPI003CC6E39D
MIAGSFYVPKSKPNKPLGEDSHFIDQEAQVIGVADGVGGFASRGIDSGKYARELMGNAAEIVKQRRFVNPNQLLQEAFLKSRLPGACTACIMAIEGNLLKATNLGDSGFAVIREGAVVYKSPAQQTKFNRPHQMERKKGGPELAEDLEVAVKAGDVIVAGTDGLFDNLFPEEIAAMVEISLEQNNQPEVLAQILATAALQKSLDRSCRSPFGVAAQAAGLIHSGGKYDDITVVAAYLHAVSTGKGHEVGSSEEMLTELIIIDQIPPSCIDSNTNPLGIFQFDAEVFFQTDIQIVSLL